MPDDMEKEIAKLLTKLRASGHAINVDSLAHSIHAEHREIGLPTIKDRIRMHINRLRSSR